MSRQLLLKSGHKKMKSAYKKLKTAYKNHTFFRNSAPYSFPPELKNLKKCKYWAFLIKANIRNR